MTFLTVIAVGTKVFSKYALHLPENYVYPFFPWEDRLQDLTCWVVRFREFHHPAFFGNDPRFSFPFAYPAPVSLPYEFFYSLPKLRFSYLLITSSATICAAWLFARELRRRGIGIVSAVGFMATCAASSWPIFVCLWIGNMEIVVGFLVGIGLYMFLKGREWTAALFLGVATGMKLFPFVFLSLYLHKSKFRHIAFFLGVAAALNLFSLWVLTGSVVVSWHGIGEGLEYLRVNDTLPFLPLSPGVDHSLFSLLKSSIVFGHEHFGSPYPSMVTMSRTLRGYMLVMAVTGTSLYFLRIRFLPVLNQILCLCVASILFTPLSIDYTLMHLYVPFGMLVILAIRARDDGRQVPGMAPVFGCMAALLAPLCEFMSHGTSVGALIKSVLLVLLLVLALRFPFEKEEEWSLCR